MGSQSVTLTDVDWDIGVDVIVTGEDDLIVDGPQGYTIATDDVRSNDNDYDDLTGTNVADISVTNTDDDTANLSITDVTVEENVVGGAMVFDVILDRVVLDGLKVDYTFSDGTATGGGVDYQGTDGTLTFDGTNAGEIQQITVTINDTNILESAEETFTVQLGTPSIGVNIAGSGIGIGTITDDDNCAPPPVVNQDIPTFFVAPLTLVLMIT